MIVWRGLAGVLALLHGLNGLRMAATPSAWYASVPGVELTGPFNPHFVVDIGFAFLVSAAGFALWAWRPALGGAFVALAAAWTFLHGVFHLIHLGHIPPDLIAFEAGLVVLPGFLGAAIAWRALARA